MYLKALPVLKAEEALHKVAITKVAHGSSDANIQEELSALHEEWVTRVTDKREDAHVVQAYDIDPFD